MKYYKKIAMLLILILTLTAGLMACGNADTTNETEETIAEETAVEDTENTEETEEETVAATVVESTAPVVIPDGFTERDFEIGYSDYEKITLSGDTATSSAGGVTVEGNTVKITEAGSYLLTGELNGQIVVDLPGTEDKVQLILDNATINNDANPYCLFTLGIVCNRIGFGAEALSYLDMAKERMMPDRKTLFRLHQELADAFKQKGEYDFRLEELEECMKLADEKDVNELTYQMGQCYFQLKQRDKAKECFNKFLEATENKEYNDKIKSMRRSAEQTLRMMMW